MSDSKQKAKEEALRLVEKFRKYAYQDGMGNKTESAKECAILCCKVVLGALPLHDYHSMVLTKKEWQEVIEAISEL